MSTKRRILFIDDEANVLREYQRSLHTFQSECEMFFESDPLNACRLLECCDFDVVFCDVRMPIMSGIDLLERIRADVRLIDLPFIIVTGDSDRKVKRKAIDLGATDLLNKPVHSADLVARLRNALRLKDCSEQLRQQNQRLEERVRMRTADLAASRIDILWRLGKAATYRDEETSDHIIRVGCYSRVIAKALDLDDEFCDTIFQAALLHDIGKIGIPDSVLRMPGKLTEEQCEILRSHCQIGVSILTGVCKLHDVASRYMSESPCLSADELNPVMTMAALIAGSHHEKWDGSGYPQGLAKEDIPIAGRIVAIADVYDTLRAARPCKKAFSVERSLTILRQDAGHHFDPAVVSAFLASFEEIRQIESDYADQLEPSAPNSEESNVLEPVSLPSTSLTPLV